MELLKVEDLTFTYPMCRTPALDGVSFSVSEGEFTVICGATGSGKSTLLRLLKRELAPQGEKRGRILYRGTSPEELPAEVTSCRIGFVTQKPEQQIVCDKVWHELAFGLENMGIPQAVIARRVAEMASYFGIESWYDKKVSELSGGQKQLLNLAAVMVMDPDILILDEPTAQLDPIAASSFIGTLKKLNRDLSLTVIITEHRTEELTPICDKLIVLENGRVLGCGALRDLSAQLAEKPELMCMMPVPVRLFHALSRNGELPVTVRECRQWIESNFGREIRSLPKKEYTHSDREALSFRGVCYRYDRALPDAVFELSLTVYEGEIFCILGGNGSGKTTALGVAAGLLKPYSGYVSVFGKKLKEYKNQSLYRECLTLLPQDVQTVFLKNTVREELAETDIDGTEIPFDIQYLYDKHPYDISGGEQQLVALAKVLATKPRLILMDEPTKGLDVIKKSEIITVMRKLKAKGVTIVVVTHDVEFAALCADRCALFFRGNAVSEGVPGDFFAENRFYTTAARTISRGYYDGAVTLDDVAELCRLNEHRSGGEEC